MTLTEKERDIIKKLLYIIKVKTERENKLVELNVNLDFREDEILDNLILDIIGFPQDNTLEFDFDVLNGVEKLNEPEQSGTKRTDFDNMFCRDWLGDAIYYYVRGEGECKNDDELIDYLCNEYINLNK